MNEVTPEALYIMQLTARLAATEEAARGTAEALTAEQNYADDLIERVERALSDPTLAAFPRIHSWLRATLLTALPRR